MSRDLVTVSAVGIVAVLISCAVGFGVGWAEAAVTFTGLVLMTVPAWFPRLLVKFLATA